MEVERIITHIAAAFIGVAFTLLWGPEFKNMREVYTEVSRIAGEVSFDRGFELGVKVTNKEHELKEKEENEG